MGLIKKIGFAFLALFVIGFIFGGDSSEQSEITGNSLASAQGVQEQIISVSSSFDDYGDIYCDEDATALQKEVLFDEKFKNNYVTWTGEVTRVAESYGTYVLNVRHCPEDIFSISDIRVSMRKDQKDKLLQLIEGDEVTYTAKMNSYGELLGLSAKDGVIVSVK